MNYLKYIVILSTIRLCFSQVYLKQWGERIKYLWDDDLSFYASFLSSPSSPSKDQKQALRKRRNKLCLFQVFNRSLLVCTMKDVNNHCCIFVKKISSELDSLTLGCRWWRWGVGSLLWPLLQLPQPPYYTVYDLRVSDDRKRKKNVCSFLSGILRNANSFFWSIYSTG